MKPVIGMTLSMNENRLTLSRDNADAVLTAGGIPFLLPYATETDVLDGMVQQIDGLLLTGGDDIDPSLFGEEPLPGLGEVEPERDRMEIALVRKMVHAGKPVLAICRGCQILCIALGGDMYQDLYSQRKDSIQHVQRGPRGYLSHSVSIQEGTWLSQIAGEDRIRVNSYHHQAVRRLPEGYIPSAIAPDGVIEAFEGDGPTWVMGVQWHPENLFRTDRVSRRLFHTLVDHARNKTTAR
ncbi:putative glutamine amidotransferase [Kroppenstedtia sanguinis]|uniref:Gamma-glutamyl-gamma-aminobutyrate hydrolase family protein n=1 Tax=Kroppenstedtia sanguinis TaxID=1380684 RepID=A0ABW4C9I3_9BACL